MSDSCEQRGEIVRKQEISTVFCLSDPGVFANCGNFSSQKFANVFERKVPMIGGEPCRIRVEKRLCPLRAITARDVLSLLFDYAFKCFGYQSVTRISDRNKSFFGRPVM